MLGEAQAIEMSIKEFAVVESIPLSDARLAFAHTKPLLDFITAHKSAATFGDAWAAYSTGRYQVHIRVTETSDPEKIGAQLSETLGINVERHYGGYSNSQLRRATSSLQAVLIDAARQRGTQSEIVHDHENGYLVVTSSDPAVQAAASTEVAAHLIPKPAVLAPATSFGGDTTRQYTTDGGVTWNNNCTVGAGVRRNSDNQAGYLTAGHCHHMYWSQGNWGGRLQNNQVLSWPQEYESCGNLSDSQVHPMLYYPVNPNYRNYFDYQPPYLQLTPVHDVAGGFYIGQPVRRVGRISSSTSSVTEDNTFPVSFQDTSCSASAQGPVDGFKTGTLGLSGDSGGPALLIYNNKFYFAGVMSAGTYNINAIISWWELMPALNSGWSICRTVSPC